MGNAQLSEFLAKEKRETSNGERESTQYAYNWGCLQRKRPRDVEEERSGNASVARVVTKGKERRAIGRREWTIHKQPELFVVGTEAAVTADTRRDGGDGQ